MKKFLAIVLAGLMLISISACGSKPAAEPTPAPQPRRHRGTRP